MIVESKEPGHKLWLHYVVVDVAVGECMLWDAGDGLGVQLGALHVQPEFRRRKIATALLRHAIALAGERLWLGVRDGNPARRLYEKLGFQEYEKRDGGITRMRWTAPHAAEPPA